MIVIENQNAIRVTLAAQQGPAGASTVAAQAAQASSEAAALRSEQARDSILAVETTSLANANSAALSATNAETSASFAFANQVASLGHSQSAALSASQSANSATNAANSAALAQIAQQGGARVFASFAQANATLNTLTTNQVVLVVQDETRGNVSAYYSATGNPVTSLTFINQAEFFFSPVPYVRSDSQNNMITKLLVLTGVIPQSQPFVNADFNNPAY